MLSKVLKTPNYVGVTDGCLNAIVAQRNIRGLTSVKIVKNEGNTADFRTLPFFSEFKIIEHVYESPQKLKIWEDNHYGNILRQG